MHVSRQLLVETHSVIVLSSFLKGFNKDGGARVSVPQATGQILDWPLEKNEYISQLELPEAHQLCTKTV